VEYELVDIYFYMMPYKYYEDFHKANKSLHNHTLDSLCDYMECLEILQSIGKPKGKLKSKENSNKAIFKHGKPKEDANHKKHYYKAYKEAGKPYRMYSSHNTNQCCRQGCNLRNNNPNLNKDFKK